MLSRGISSLQNFISGYGKRTSLVVAWILILYVSGSSFYYFNTGSNNSKVINMDGWGYYAYLPFVFETGAKSYEGYINYSIDQDTTAFFLKGPEGRKVNKFFVGEAVLLLPFYAAGHLCASFAQEEITGYSKPFFLAIAIAAYCYFALSLLTLRKTLLHLQFSEFVTSFVLIMGTVCTNLVWYVSDEPSMSHAFSFALFSTFIFLLLKISEQWNKKTAFLLYLILGLIIITRPTNLFILLFITYFSNFSTIKRLFLFFPGWPVFGAICFIQLLLYYLQTGSWIVWSYEGSYFDLAHPHLIDTWFSWQKGMFIFFPVFFLSIGGFMIMIRSDYKKALLLILPLLIVFYVLSSWHAWHYGWSFGMRGYIEFYPFLFIPLAILARWAFSKPWSAIAIIGMACYCFMHTRSVTRMARVDYGFIQEMTAEKWSSLLFKHRDEMRDTMNKFRNEETQNTE